VLGLLAWVACAITGPFAWSMGNKALREIDANPTAYSNRTMVVVGRVLGIVATILGGLAIVGFGALIVLAVFVGTTTEPEVRELDAVVRGLRTVSGR
jgi:short subunit fatty acids transporter